MNISDKLKKLIGFSKTIIYTFKMVIFNKNQKFSIPSFLHNLSAYTPKYYSIFYHGLSFLPESKRIRVMKFFQKFSKSLKPLPDLILIGAQRSGSSSLYYNLIKHPLILAAESKELHYFDLNYTKGLKWYKSLFPSFFYKRFLERIFNHRVITIEGSPYYMFHPAAVERIHSKIPNAKLIMILRDPIKRAHSQYNRNVRIGREKLSWEEAIDQEQKRLEGEEEKLCKDPSYYSFNHQRYSYLSRGIYINQIKRVHKIFPKDQVLIIIADDFFKNPQAVFDKIFKFLNLPAFKIKEVKRVPGFKYKEMEPNTKNKLIEYFKPYNKELSQYLGVDINWDKNS